MLRSVAGKVAALAFAIVLSFGTASMAQQPEAAPGLNAAMAAGDTSAVNAIVAANSGNPTALSAIANALLAFAQANPNSTGAALMAAIAVTTGALSGDAAIAALNIVGSNPAALALLSNVNAPKVGGTTFGGSDTPGATTVNNSQTGSPS